MIDLIRDGVRVEFRSRDSACAAAGNLPAARDVPAIEMDLSARRRVNKLLAAKRSSMLEIIDRLLRNVGPVKIQYSNEPVPLLASDIDRLG